MEPMIYKGDLLPPMTINEKKSRSCSFVFFHKSNAIYSKKNYFKAWILYHGFRKAQNHPIQTIRLTFNRFAKGNTQQQQLWIQLKELTIWFKRIVQIIWIIFISWKLILAIGKNSSRNCFLIIFKHIKFFYLRNSNELVQFILEQIQNWIFAWKKV